MPVLAPLVLLANQYEAYPALPSALHPRSCPALSCPTLPGTAQTCPILPYSAIAYPACLFTVLHCFSAPVQCPVLLTMPGPVQPCPAQTDRSWPCPLLFGTARSCLALSGAAGRTRQDRAELPDPVWSCPVLSDTVQPCPACIISYFSCHFVCAMHCVNPNCTVLGSRART